MDQRTILGWGLVVFGVVCVLLAAFGGVTDSKTVIVVGTVFLGLGVT